MSRTLLVWCSPKDSPTPLWVETGQGLITRIVIDSDDISSFVISPSLNSYLFSILRLFLFALSRPRRSFVLYVVSSRSLLGFLRDVPAFLLALSGHTVYAHVHGADLQDLFAIPILGRFAWAIYRRATAVIFPSSHALLQIPQYTSLNSAIIHNCLPISTCVQTPNSQHAIEYVLPPRYNSQVNILWNSNLMASKGLIEVLNGFGLMSENIEAPDSVLHLLGSVVADREMSASLMAETVNSYASKQGYNLVGKVGASVAHEWVKLSDIVVLNTRYRTECQPLALIAAMCEGKVIVASGHMAVRSTLLDYPYFEIEDTTSSSSVASSLLQACSACRNPAYLEKLSVHAASARQLFSVARFIADFKALVGV